MYKRQLINHIPTGNTFHCYLNPLLEGEMPIESFKVHGLSVDFLKDKPLFSEMIENLIIFIGDSNLIIHNAKFDIGFINYEIQRPLYFIVYKSYIKLCVMYY